MVLLLSLCPQDCYLIIGKAFVAAILTEQCEAERSELSRVDGVPEAPAVQFENLAVLFTNFAEDIELSAVLTYASARLDRVNISVRRGIDLDASPSECGPLGENLLRDRDGLHIAP